MKPNNFPVRSSLDGTEELYTQTNDVSEKFTLDDVKIFSSQTLEQVLTAGSSTGGIPITSPDTNTFMEIADSVLISKVLDLANTTQLSMYTNQCDLNINDSASGDYSNINVIHYRDDDERNCDLINYQL